MNSGPLDSPLLKASFLAFLPFFLAEAGAFLPLLGVTGEGFGDGLGAALEAGVDRLLLEVRLRGTSSRGSGVGSLTFLLDLDDLGPGREDTEVTDPEPTDDAGDGAADRVFRPLPRPREGVERGEGMATTSGLGDRLESLLRSL